MRPARRGFSLVVISIIALLLPAIKQARESARVGLHLDAADYQDYVYAAAAGGR
jgi:hypothetical protein